MQRQHLRLFPSGRRRAQQGQYLVAALLALAVFAVFIGSWASMQRRHFDQGRASAQGAALAQFGVGLRGFVASVQAGTTPVPGAALVGVNWLKPPSCGGLATNPVAGFVPCTFTGGAFGPQFSTTVTDTPATNAVQIVTSFRVQPFSSDGSGNPPAVFAANIAAAAQAAQTSPLGGIFLSVYSNTPPTVLAQPNPSAITAAGRGYVVLVADNAPSNDIWLRVDGTNQMLANLNMGGNSIANAKDGSFAGNVRVQGTEQIDNGLSVTSGTVDARGGVLAPDVQVTGINRFASQGIYDAQALTGATSYTVTKPDCSQADGGAGSTPAIYAMLQGTGNPEGAGGGVNANGNGDALYQSTVVVTDSGATWTVTPVIQAADFTLGATTCGSGATAYTCKINLNKYTAQANASNATVVVMTKCR